MKTRILQGLIFGLIFLFASSTVFQPTSKVQAAEPPLQLDAPSAILLDADTGKILYKKNADKVRSPASMTKMMTEYLVLQAIEDGDLSWDSNVKINDYMYKLSHNLSLSGLPLRKDVAYTVEDMYKAMAVSSDNAATAALAKKVAGSEKKFVKQMNKKAKELGMKNTHFVNSSGLNNSDLYGHEPMGGPNEENRMSARDTAQLAYHLLKDHPKALKYTSLKHPKFKTGVDKPLKMDVWNYMLPGLVHGYKGVDGLKTGHTEKAGYCFTGTAKHNDRRLISVVMKTDSIQARFDETEKLLDYGFDNFKKATLLEKGQSPKKKKHLPVTKGKDEKIAIQTKKPIQTLIKKGSKKKYQAKLKLDDNKLKNGSLTAPVKKGEQVGTVKMTYTGNNKPNGYLTDSNDLQTATPVVTTESVEKKNMFMLALGSVGDFFSGMWTSVSGMVKGWF